MREVCELIRCRLAQGGLPPARLGMLGWLRRPSKLAELLAKEPGGIEFPLDDPRVGCSSPDGFLLAALQRPTGKETAQPPRPDRRRGLAVPFNYCAVVPPRTRP
jgi:hypothetical protein